LLRGSTPQERIKKIEEKRDPPPSGNVLLRGSTPQERIKKIKNKK
jgi:hypothetical protein